MGGNALKPIPISRMNKNIYNIIENKILLILKQYYTDCMVIISKPEKEDYGDMDVLYLANHNNILDIIKKEFNPIKLNIISLPSLCSIAYNYENNYYQIDFICCNSIEQYNSSKFYFSYGDLGGIIGRMTNNAGIKFGHDGLWLNYHSSGDINKNGIYIHLTHNVEEICKFLNLDYMVYNKGFNKTNDIFNWICSSNYFYTNIYENLNHDYKKRIIKRPMFQQFIAFIKNINKPFNVQHNNYIKIKQDEALVYFSKKDYLIEQLNIITKKVDVKKKFNGKLFINLNVDVKNINNYIEKFKNYIIEKYKIQFEDYILSNSEENIINEIKEIF